MTACRERSCLRLARSAVSGFIDLGHPRLLLESLSFARQDNRRGRVTVVYRVILSIGFFQQARFARHPHKPKLRVALAGCSIVGFALRQPVADDAVGLSLCFSAVSADRDNSGGLMLFPTTCGALA